MPQSVGLRLRRRNKALQLAKWAAFTAAPPTFAFGFEKVAKWPLVWPIASQDLLLLTAATAVSLGLLGLGRLFSNLIHEPEPIPSTFRLTPSTDNEVVLREGDDERLLSLIAPDDQRTESEIPIVVITGASGVGKSTIIDKRVQRQIERRGDRYFRVRSYKDLQSTLSKLAGADKIEDGDDVFAALAAAHPQGKTYLFFDQFEPELAEAAVNKQLARYYTKLFQAAVKYPSIILALLVRKEWLFDAAQFLDHSRVQHRTVPFAVDRDDTRRWQEKFTERLGGDVQFAEQLIDLLRSRPGGFLAIEARMVDVVLAHESGSVHTFKAAVRSFGIDAIISRFFGAILRSSPEVATDSLVAAKILTALVSDRPGLRNPRSIDELSCIVHEESQTVSEVCEYLVARNLVVAQGEDSDRKFSVVHDYVSDYISKAPEVPIEPADRDHVRTFSSWVARNSQMRDFTRFVPAGGITFGRVLMALYLCAAILTIFAGFYFEADLVAASKTAHDAIISATTLGDKLRVFVLATASGHDPLWYRLGDSAANYYALLTVAIMIVQLIFMLYIDAISRGFLHIAGKRGIGMPTATAAQLNQLRRTTWTANILAATAVIASLYSLLAKSYFIFWPALGGLVLGWAIYRMGMEKGLARQSQVALAPVGLKIAMNITSMAIVFTGILLATQYAAVFILDFPQLYVGLILLTAAMYVVFIVQLWRLHTSPEAMSRRRAYYDRMAID